MTSSHRRGSTPVRVALINDYEIVVRGLEHMLAAYSGRVEVVELDAQSTCHSPVDVALYGHLLRGTDRRLRHRRRAAQPHVAAVAVLHLDMQVELIETAKRKGVLGYLSKSLQAPELVSALERVAAGEVVVLPSADIGSSATVELAGGDWPGRREGLTARQAEVVALITQGFSNQEIAERTYLTMNTIKSYIREAYHRMGVSTRTQAVLWGIEHGMLPDVSRVTRS